MLQRRGPAMLRSSSRRVDVPIVADEETDLRGDLEGVLRDLSRRAPGVLGAVIADESGLTVAGNGGHREQVDVLAAMATLIARSADIVFVKIEMRHVGARLAEMLGLGVSPSSGIEELFVMTRGGVLLRHYSSTLRTDIDRDILSGMLVAVQEFVKQTLAMKQGGLDELRYGAYTILFVRGTETVAAAVVRGAGSEDMKYPIMDALLAFESRFARELASWSGDTSAFPGIDDYFSKVLHT